jgi:hypothetical protein
MEMEFLGKWFLGKMVPPGAKVQ